MYPYTSLAAGGLRLRKGNTGKSGKIIAFVVFLLIKPFFVYLLKPNFFPSLFTLDHFMGLSRFWAREERRDQLYNLTGHPWTSDD